MTRARSSARFEVRTSTTFRVAVVGGHGLLTGMTLAGPFAGWVSGVVLFLLLTSAWWNWRCDGGSAVLLCREGRWLLTAPGLGEESPLRWLPATRIGPRLSLLHARTAERRYFWAVAADSMPADLFRELRVRVSATVRHGH